MFTTMGETCSSFVANEFPDDQVLLIMALWVKARVEKSDYAATELLHAVDGWSPELLPSTSSAILFAKSQAHKILSYNAIHREDPAQAIQHLSTCRDVLYLMGINDDSIYLNYVQLNIAKAEAMLYGTEVKPSKREILLQLCKDQYEKMKEEGSPSVVKFGMIFARALVDATKLEDAHMLLEDLNKLSCQVHGPNHPTSKNVKSLMNNVQSSLLLPGRETKKSSNKGALQNLINKDGGPSRAIRPRLVFICSFVAGGKAKALLKWLFNLQVPGTINSTLCEFEMLLSKSLALLLLLLFLCLLSRPMQKAAS